jgi:hypothetical protein
MNILFGNLRPFLGALSTLSFLQKYQALFGWLFASFFNIGFSDREND